MRGTGCESVMWLCGAFAFRQASPPSRVYGGDVHPLAQDPKPLPKPSGQEARKLGPEGPGAAAELSPRGRGLDCRPLPGPIESYDEDGPSSIGDSGKSAVGPLGGNGEEDEPERERRRPRLFNARLSHFAEEGELITARLLEFVLITPSPPAGSQHSKLGRAVLSARLSRSVTGLARVSVGARAALR